jgi:hypothetical protein
MMTILLAGATARAQVLFGPPPDPVFDPCLGEEIVWTGAVHTTAHSETTPNGLIHIVSSFNFQRVTGTGQTSGLTITPHCTGVETEFLSDGPISTPTVFTTVVHCALAANTSVMMVRQHLTVTPKGVTAADYSVDQIICTP